MTLTLSSRRRTMDPSIISPLSIAWHSAFWASDPSWTPPADGGAVSSWRDASGNGHTATQATGTKQPTFRSSSANFGNRPVVEFDGTTDYLQTAAFTSLAQPNEIVVVARLRAVVATAKVFDGIASGSREGLQTVTGPNRWQIFASTAATAADMGAGGSTNRRFIRAVFDATSTLDVDGVNLISASAGTEPLTGLTLGARFDGTLNFCQVDIAFIGLSDTLLTTAQRRDLLRWARSFYGTA